MADLETALFFQSQQDSDATNNVCCDTGSANPQWASPSHGIYISIEAAGVHRSLGVKVSRVLSTTMDSWKPLQLKMMKLGGNKRFAEFLQEQGVPDDMPIRQKYTTRAADWYQKNLLAIAEGSAPPEPLAHGIGHMPSSGAATRAGEFVLDEVFCSANLLSNSSTQCAKKQTRGRCLSSGSSNSSTTDSSSESLSPKPPFRQLQQLLQMDELQQLQFQWPWVSEGDRAAERLKTMSTGTMRGFGSEDGPATALITDAAAILGCIAVVCGKCAYTPSSVGMPRGARQNTTMSQAVSAARWALALVAGFEYRRRLQ